MISKFREATGELHEQVEKENLARLIMDHTIGVDNYKLLLLQNYIAYYITEKEIERFLRAEEPAKHTRLKKDLDHLQVDARIINNYKNTFTCKSLPEAMGAAYVVEGSALGGRLIAIELEECRKLEGLGEPYFFNLDRSNMEGWKKFKKMVECQQFSDEEVEQATLKAQETFRFFLEVFRLSFREAFFTAD